MTTPTRTPTLSRAAPLRFLIGVVLGWTVGRGVVLAEWREIAASPHPALDRAMARLAPLSPALAAVPPLLKAPPPRHPSRQFARLDPARAKWRSAAAPLAPATEERQVALLVPAPPVAREPDYARATGMAEAGAVLPPPAAARSRWSGSAWTFVRGGGRATALSPGGQIGGGQAGARLFYRIDPAGRIAATARISRTIGGIDQTEASAGIDWTPFAHIPVHILAERRIAIDKGGRNALTLGMAGGAYAVPIATHWRLDGYGEAGVVGAHRRDLYADGAVRVARAIDIGHGASLAIGGGAWAAAQPAADRVDIGPSAVLRLPVAGHAVSVALDWRERIAGDAKPGSGAALTVAMDF